MAVREGLLLLLAERPRHGYDLRAEFEARTAAVWKLNSGQVYTTLDRLERDGLVVAEADRDDPSGRRRRYAVTDAGRSALEGWLAEVTRVHELARDEILMKVLLALPDLARVRVVIDRHRHATLLRLRDLRREHHGDELAASIVTDAEVARLEADLTWLDRCEQRLARPKDLP